MNALPRLRAVLFGLCLIPALLLSACSQPAVIPPMLLGTVTDAYTGKPVAASLVVGETQLNADVTGMYRTTEWKKDQIVQASAPGYESVSIDLQTHIGESTIPTVTLDLKLRPNTLSGIVTDAYTGKPLAGVQVQAGGTLSATTGSDGRYMLNGVSEQVQLSLNIAGYDAATQSLSRATSFDTSLRPNTLSGIVTDELSGAPIAGVTVRAGSLSAVTDADGRYTLAGVPEQGTLAFESPDHAEVEAPFARTTEANASMRPDVLSAVLVDLQSGQPVTNATVIATPSLSETDVAYTRIDNQADGAFRLENMPESGFIQVLAPGYRKAVLEIKPGNIPAEIKLEPFIARGVYITSAVASVPRLREKFFSLIENTELNAIVIDIKSDLRDDLGIIYYDSQVPIVQELGTARPYVDMRAVVAEAKRRGIYTIARVHIFSHDNALADARPEWAAQDRINGGVFADYPAPGIRYAWLDPWNRNVWDYNIQLSVEVALMGFDEINYDYIRFPSLEFDPMDKERLQLSKEPSTPEERYANIGEMLRLSQRAINGAGAFLSVDVFGYTTFRPDPLIGQNLQVMGQHTDYIYPMIYPSHFAPGELGLPLPAAAPYEVIYASLVRGERQVEGVRARLRPWLQDFTLIWVPKDQIVEYGPEEVRAQIRAVEDYGMGHNKIAGWVLYDSANTYTEEALRAAP